MNSSDKVTEKEVMIMKKGKETPVLSEQENAEQALARASTEANALAADVCDTQVRITSALRKYLKTGLI